MVKKKIVNKKTTNKKTINKKMINKKTTNRETANKTEADNIIQEETAQNKITILGIGMGVLETLTIEAIKAIGEAAYLIGAKRMVEPYEDEKRCVCTYKTEEIISLLSEEIDKKSGIIYSKIAILMSGDSGFYSGTKELLGRLQELYGIEWMQEKIRILPGISSLSFFCAKIGKSWENAEIISLHGAKENLWQAVYTHEKTFAITGGGVEEALQSLEERGLGEVKVYLGEALSYPEECIRNGTVSTLLKEFKEKPAQALAVLFFENQSYRSEIMTGLPDDWFVRGDVPMTKAEVRAVVMSKLCVRKGDIVYDIGAGTGSVSVEMALAARQGSVYAIECEKQALELLEQNKKKFCLQNMEIIAGMAPEVCGMLPVPDAAFIGGTKGRMEEIIKGLLIKNPAIRLVINTITLESTAKVMELIEKYPLTDVEIVQMQINKARQAGESHLMMAQNPITIISCRGCEAVNGAEDDK